MVKKVIFLLFIISLHLLNGCSKSDGGGDTLFSNPVSSQPAVLVDLRGNPYLGSTSVGNSLDITITFGASGGLNITSLSASLSGDSVLNFKGGNYPGTGGSCGSNLSNGKNCTIVITYSPTAITTNHTTLSFSYADSVGSKSLTEVLNADSHPILTFLYGTQYDFGNKFVGTSTDLVVTVTNTGIVPANSLAVPNLSAPFSFKGGAYPGTGGTCGTSIAVGTTCNLIINFAPINNGSKTQTISLNYTDGGHAETNSLNLTAWALYPAVLTVSDSSTYDFGNVVAGIDHDKVYTVSYNSGDVTATSLALTGFNTGYNYKGGTYPGTGGTCGTTISSGSCTIIVTLHSNISALYQNTFSLQYNDGQNMQNISRTIKGTIKQKPIVTVSPLSNFNFGAIHTGQTSAVKTYTLTYVSGELPANNIGISGMVLPFSQAGGTCGTTLSSGSCTITLTLSPTAIGNWQQGISFNYDDYITTVSQTTTISGSSEAQLAFTAGTSINYGTIVQGTTNTAYATLNLVGGVGATAITSNSPGVPFTYSGGGAYPGLLGTCSNSLASGTCLIYFTFSPTDFSNHQFTYTLSYYDGFATQSLNLLLNGTGGGPAVLSLSAAAFGAVSLNDHLYKVITITNATSTDATNVSMSTLPSGYTFKNGTYPGTGGTCGATIAAGTSCDIVINFTPSAVGSFNGNITFNYNNGQNNTTTIGALTGAGITTNNLFISNDDIVAYPALFLNTGNSKTFTLTHGGGGTTVTGIQAAALPADFTYPGGFPGGGTCGSSLASGSSCTFIARFSPLSIGIKNANLTINYNNGSNQSVTRQVLGEGDQQPVLAISPGVYDFGLQPIAGVYETTLTVSTPLGYYPAINLSGTIQGSGFAFKGGSYPGTGGTCSANLALGDTCTIVITFSPLLATSYSGSVGINYNDYVANQQVKINLTGTGKNAAVLGFTNSSPYNFGTIIQTASSTATITLNNTGTSSATAIVPTALSAPYAFTGGTYPGTSGTCGATLAAGATCTMALTYSPTTTGVSNSALTMNYYNGNVTTTSVLNLTGTALSQAVLSLSDVNPYSYGSVVVNSALSKTFTITNGGSTAAIYLSTVFPSAQYLYKGGSYPGTGGTCSTTIAATSTCTIIVNFAPTALGLDSGTFKFNYNDGIRSEVENKTLSGTGSASLVGGSFMKMIPIKSINTTDPQTFFSDALSINGDKVYLNNGLTISGRDKLLIEQGKLKNYFNLIDNSLSVPSDWASWGLSKINVGDLNNDGVEDFVIFHFNPSTFNTPEDSITFTCFNSKDLSVIYNISIPNPNHYYVGLSSAIIPQDIDGDGHNDFITGLYQLEGNTLVLKDFLIFSSKTGMPIDYNQYVNSL